MSSSSAISEARLLRALLDEAGQEAMRLFRDTSPTLKADGTWVTDADTACEKLLFDGLAAAFPNMGIVSEEGAHQSGNDGTWHVDPIDGTSAYLEGLAHWGPTICLVQDNALVLGALWLPRLGEFWIAKRGQGAWRNDTRLPQANASQAFRSNCLYVPSRFHRRQRVNWTGKIRALGSSASHLAQVAAGHGTAALISRWHLWDVGCGILLVEECGGVITDLAGNGFDPLSQPGTPFLAGDPDSIGCLTTLNS